jgi:hypothetical protein
VRWRLLRERWLTRRQCDANISDHGGRVDEAKVRRSRALYCRVDIGGGARGRRGARGNLQRDLQALSGSKLIFIATVHKDGSQSKAAPVWFTLSADRNSIMIQTGGKSWKAKRIFAERYSKAPVGCN